MSLKRTSLKGTVVDFELLRAKEELSRKPATEEVVERHQFIDRKRRRAPKSSAEIEARREAARKELEALRREKNGTPAEKRTKKPKKQDASPVEVNENDEEKTDDLDKNTGRKERIVKKSDSEK